MTQTSDWSLDLGATPLACGGTQFRVWAPSAKTVAVRLFTENGGGDTRSFPLQAGDLGYFEGVVGGVGQGARYAYLLDGEKVRPDPASRFQPDGVHGPSMVIDPTDFRWTDQAWRGLPLEQFIIYELHTGTFSQAGTFEGIIPQLDYLRREVGITAIELMPVAQFPGSRNWGYDGVDLFAPQASYGGPRGLKALVDACHRKGLAVILDVVYNHFGPEGNYLGEFGPYFTDQYRTPWGSAVNYDGPDSDEVRHFIVSNALYWIHEYHIDALRLDAIHGIYDFSATHLLGDLASAVHGEGRRLGRSVAVIAESDLNDARIISPRERGGLGLDAQWNDDFHHALHTLLTGEQRGYYADFGRLEQLATALQEGFIFSGQRSVHRRRRHGGLSRHRPASQFVVFSQNHDQIGNRACGDRLTTLVPADALKLAAAAVLLAPNIPLLFMGEEYGESAPFQYFTDHGDQNLVEAVRRGRRAEFAAFGWEGEVPDPQDPATFERSRVSPASSKKAAPLLRWYRRLIALRTSQPVLGAAGSDRHGCRVYADHAARALVMHRWLPGQPDACVILGFNPAETHLSIQEPKGSWSLYLDSSAGVGNQAEPSKFPNGLTVGSQEASIILPPYGVAIYLNNHP
jgi:maltooligosyltrehalose trehalohydrolase